jgi:hypothetical protein
VALEAHVTSVCFKYYCKYFRVMLHVFHIDVAKVDWDVVYAAMVIHVCYKRLFPMFYLFSDVCCKNVYLDLAYVSHRCCICFIWMLLMFAMVSSVLTSVSDAHFKYFFYLHTYVASVAF